MRTPWRRTTCRGLLALWLAGVAPLASAAADLRINDVLLPGKSIGLLEQALTRIKFNADKATLRQGLVENHLLARAVEAELSQANR